ncbi:MAG: hypothetical protein E7656_04725 [Ruminococcaceae bacterium]|nr:hypothetical protein [Oscillospiraceae bacterium]
MKNPISFLTFSSISLSVCLLAQYLTEAGADAFFLQGVFEGGKVIKTAFFGISRLSQLFFGIYCALICEKNRFVNLYFFGFSNALFLIVHVLLFENRACFFAAAFSAVQLFVSAVLLLTSDDKKTRGFLMLPNILTGIFLFTLSVLGATT